MLLYTRTILAVICIVLVRNSCFAQDLFDGPSTSVRLGDVTGPDFVSLPQIHLGVPDVQVGFPVDNCAKHGKGLKGTVAIFKNSDPRGKRPMLVVDDSRDKVSKVTVHCQIEDDGSSRCPQGVYVDTYQYCYVLEETTAKPEVEDNDNHDNDNHDNDNHDNDNDDNDNHENDNDENDNDKNDNDDNDNDEHDNDDNDNDDNDNDDNDNDENDNDENDNDENDNDENDNDENDNDDNDNDDNDNDDNDNDDNDNDAQFDDFDNTHNDFNFNFNGLLPGRHHSHNGRLDDGNYMFDYDYDGHSHEVQSADDYYSPYNLFMHLR